VISAWYIILSRPITCFREAGEGGSERRPGIDPFNTTLSDDWEVGNKESILLS